MTPRRTTDDHSTFEELAVGYALHALEPEDELLFDEHLASCSRCRADVAQHAVALGDLADAVPQLEPPASLLAGIRAAIAEEPREQVAPASAPVPLAPRQREDVRLRRGWLLSAAAGVTALVLGLGVATAVLRHDRDAATATADRLASAVKTLEKPGATTVRLADFDGTTRAVVVAQGSSLSLVVDGLAPNDAGSVYVLWGQDRAGQVRAMSTFDVPRGTDVVAGLRLPTPMSDLSALMVTHEPGRTAPVKSEQKVLAAGSV